MVQAGRLGINHAIDKFDLSRPVRFITYARPWVRAMQQRELTERLASMGGSQRIVARYLFRAELGVNQSAADARHEFFTRVDQRSLNLKIGEGEWTLADVVPADSLTAEELLLDSERTREHEAVVQKILSRVPVRLRDFVKRRMAPEGERATLEEVGDALGVCRERARQIDKEMRSRLRHVVANVPEARALWEDAA
jgi:RNA polymerase sigma factor (sigma-70 family)